MQESMKAAGKESFCTDLHRTYCGNAPAASSFFMGQKETLPSLSWRKPSLLTSPPRYSTCWMGFRVTLGSTQMPLISTLFLRSDLFPFHPPPLVPIILTESEKWSCGYAFEEHCVFEKAATGPKGKVWGCPFFNCWDFTLNMIGQPQSMNASCSFDWRTRL